MLLLPTGRQLIITSQDIAGTQYKRRPDVEILRQSTFFHYEAHERSPYVSYGEFDW